MLTVRAKLYDLTTLQREANKAFGYTAQQTLDYTQSLYEGKLVTYPRTDSQFLSDDMAQTALDVAKLCDTYFGFGISHTPDISKVINNSKVSGHHAIIPTSGIATADLSSLPSGERNILTLIATKLICATAPAHKYEAVKLTGICNGTEFTATGRTVLEMGWKAYAKQSDKKNEEKSLPAVSEGQTFTAAASKGEHFTSPPKPYTEDTLLSAILRTATTDKKLLDKIADGLSVMDKSAEIQRDKKGNIIYDKETKDTEIVKFDESIEDYMAREVLPHVPDAQWFFEEDLSKKSPVVKTGAEIPFTRYFYKYQQPKPSEELEQRFLELEKSVSERIARLFG